MIQVVLAPEPAGFDAAVRQKGLSAIDELVGRPPRVPHPGPQREKIADHESDIPSDRFPTYWRNALGDMLTAYGRRCAFLALYLEHATGNPSVDHMLPKSKHWDEVYEWHNYRLCAASINGRKSNLAGLIDPVECLPNWFALEMVGFQVTPGVAAPDHLEAEMKATCELVNQPDCCAAREEYVVNYQQRNISIDYLRRRAPFVAGELQRQGRLHPADQ